MNRTSSWFVAPQTPLKGTAVPFKGVCRKREKQLNNGKHSPVLNSFELSCISPLKFEGTAQDSLKQPISEECLPL